MDLKNNLKGEIGRHIEKSKRKKILFLCDDL